MPAHCGAKPDEKEWSVVEDKIGVGKLWLSGQFQTDPLVYILSVAVWGDTKAGFNGCHRKHIVCKAKVFTL